MDDTNGEGLLDATTRRKRRSSILKSQRPPRTPFSELEFNVATPTDTVKSRRVSFSKRTGVAEFVTNEATTTWKTIYVEQNRSLESSINESAINPPRQTISHLGKRMFDQQFQEEEVISFQNTIMTSSKPRMQEANTSLSVNFAQQISKLECELDERKLLAPQPNFELSTFTDHRSKLFGDDLTNPTLSEMSNKININFSVVEPVGTSDDKCDDLDEIQRDLLRSRPNSYQRPFSEMRDVSEYIEVDLNMTHIGIKSDDLDMSITDTIRSPKVQEISKSNTSIKYDKKSHVNNDWAIDKENIVINPYVAPEENVNFAINEIPDQILVFDGRKLTIQSGNNDPFEAHNKQNNSETLLPRQFLDRTERKTIDLNVNDDLPNLLDMSLVSKPYGLPTKKNVEQKTVIYDNGEMANISVTQAIPTNILVDKGKRNTIVFENGDLSITQAVPSNVVMANKNIIQNKTVIYDEGNISLTQAVPVNMLFPDKTKASQNYFDLSFTQAVPNNMLISNKPSQHSRRDTIVYETDAGDISITRVLPSNIIISQSQKINEKTKENGLSEKNQPILHTDDVCDIFTTNDNPLNVTVSNNTKFSEKNALYKRENQYNISDTQILSLNVDKVAENKLLQNHDNEKRCLIISDRCLANTSIAETIPQHISLAKNESLYKVTNIADISVTQALPSNIIIGPGEKDPMEEFEGIPGCNRNIDNKISDGSDTDTKKFTSNRQSEIISKNTDAVTSPKDTTIVKLTCVSTNNLNESTQELIPSNSLMTEELHKNYVDMSITQVLQSNDVLQKTCSSRKGGTAVYEPEDVTNCKSTQELVDMSITRVLQSNDILQKTSTDPETVVFDTCEVNNPQFMQKLISSDSLPRAELRKSCVDMSITQVLQSNNILETNTELKRGIEVFHGEVSSNKIDPAALDNVLLTERIYSSEPLTMSIHNNVVRKFETPATCEINMSNSNSTMTLESATVHPKHNQLVNDSKLYNNFVTSSELQEPNEKLQKNCSLKSATDHNYQDVFVYQAVTSHKVSKHQGDINGENTMHEGDQNPWVEQKNSKPSDISSSLHIEPKFTDDKKMAKTSSLNPQQPSEQNQKIAILAKLLSMSGESMDTSVHGIDDKNVMISVKSQLAIEHSEQDSSETEIRSDSLESTECSEVKVNVISELVENVLEPRSFLSEQKVIHRSVLEAENLTETVLNLNHEQLQYQENKEMLSNSSYETKSSDSTKVMDNKSHSEDKFLKKANDTNELLEMLTDFTDKTIIKQTNELDKDVKGNNKEEKPDLIEPKSMNQTKSRISMALSHTELFNNILKAQAALQQSMDMDESECYDDSHDTSNEEPDEVMEEINLRRRSSRVSTDVVKTLQFDDSLDDMKPNSKSSALRKIALGDISCSKDSKAKVIPTYLNDVCDNIKSLMEDLVKPTADVQFEVQGVDKIIHKPIPTCNTEVQANIITSSQIDLNVDSCPVSEYNVFSSKPSIASGEDIKDLDTTKATLAAVESQNDILSRSGDISEMNFNETNLHNKDKPKEILVFDLVNPLNNVIFPSGDTEVHKYSPRKSVLSHSVLNSMYQINESVPSDSLQSVLENNFKDTLQVGRFSTQYNINSNRVGRENQIDNSKRESVDDQKINSINKVTFSVNNSVQDNEKHIKDTEMNTLIVMKSNKELLEESSSLALFDDGQKDINIKGYNKSKTNHSRKTSPIKVIYKPIYTESENDSTSQVNLTEAVNIKGKKRIHDPVTCDQHKKATLSTPDVTPKPLSKIQKKSTSPKDAATSRSVRMYNSIVDNATSESEKSFNKCCKGQAKNTARKYAGNGKPKFGSPTIVQHVTAVIKMGTGEKPETADSGSEFSSCSTLKTETISQKDLRECTSSEMTSSFTSSNAIKGLQCMPSLVTTTCHDATSLQRDVSRLDWHTRLDDQGCTLVDCDSSVNILNKIDELSFMGGRECEWDVSELDRWRFLLMCRRLRLTVRLKQLPSHTQLYVYGDTRRDHVHAGTPVTSVSVEPAYEEMEPIASACVRLACESMRYECVRGAGVAAELPVLLRRCAGVAKVARHWARAMRDARAHLAYSLSDSGALLLKVANLHIRRVYEVTMRVELVVEDAREAAWPRACHLAVRDVTGGRRDVTAGCGTDVLRRVLARVPHDWGHVPRTIWKVFRHLKNKTAAELPVI